MIEGLSPLQQPWKSVRVELTAVQVANLFTTPVALGIKAVLGVTRIPRVVRIFKRAGDAYTVPSGSDLKVSNLTNTQSIFVVETQGLLDQADERRTSVGTLRGGDTGVPLYYIEHQSISGGNLLNPATYDWYILMKSADVTPGANSPGISVEVWYEDWPIFGI